MSTTIKLKRGSGSDPQASDLAVGEVAVRTDSGRLFTKKDNGSIADVGGGVQSGAIVDSDINASANISKTKLAIADATSSTSGYESAADKAKLDGIESGATADQTASEIVSLLSDQNISTSGNITTTGDLTVGGTYPAINLYDSNNNPDWRIQNNDGMFAIYDQTNGANRIQINSDGHIDLLANVDISSLDVTGATNLAELTTITKTTSSQTESILKVKHSNLTQGIGFGYNTISAIGSNTNVDLRLESRGSGKIYLIDNVNAQAGIDVTGAITGTDVIETTGHVVGVSDSSDSAFIAKGDGSSVDGCIQLNCWNNNHGVKIKSPPHSAAATYTLVLPQDIQNGKYLTVDASGNTSWGTPTDTNTTYSVGDGGLTQKNFTTTLKNKLDGIEASATADQTAAEIRTLVESASDSNVFTDADHSKLNGIEASATADQTASEILTLIKTVDGDGSGLAADVVDGLHASSFLRSDVHDTQANQRIEFNACDTNNYDTIATATSNQGAIEIRNSGVGNDAFMTFHAGSDFAFYFGLDADTNDLSVGGWSMGANKYRVWHAGNDGAGSGLDADNLDGQQGSYYLDYNNFTSTPTIPTNNNQLTNGAGYITSAALSGASDGGNAALLDGIDSTQFVRADADDTMAGIYTLSSTSRDCLNFSGNATDDNRGISFNGRIGVSADYNDGYLRLNNASEFSNGVYTPLVMRADGGFQVDGNLVISGTGYMAYSRLTGTPTIPTNNNQLTNGAGYSTFSGSYNDLTNKPTIPSAVTNNNQLTNGAGYITSANGGNAATLDGIDSSQFVRSDTADTITATLTARTIIPQSGNTYDLGSTSARWNNLYVNDMHFSNEGSQNSIDGTWGDWTLQEGETELYMINNRSGQKFKIAMIPV